MVRRKVDIKAIEEKSRRHTAFTKRRQGLFKKAKDLCTNFEAEAAVITFSKAGNVFAFGHPAVDPVVNRYLSDNTSSSLTVNVNGNINGNERVHGGNQTVEEEEMPPLSEAERKIQELMGKGGQEWNLAIGELGLNELDKLEAVIENIKRITAARAMEIVASGENQELECFGKNSIVPYPYCNLRR
ncbi:Agamous-like MADS-box protein AGL62 [Abeliophyllum distichum]|uniref:Agamous-like MADS-box protein AGL62 n=1 Tax=Abeliophyllum distichum TaxID=126358 RepID=A0ABD1URX8_9LAMI